MQVGLVELPHIYEVDREIPSFGDLGPSFVNNNKKDGSESSLTVGFPAPNLLESILSFTVSLLPAPPSVRFTLSLPLKKAYVHEIYVTQESPLISSNLS